MTIFHSDAVKNKVLLPGELYFGSDCESVTTLLGSCVAITLWHPQKKLLGVCHYVLPSRARKKGAALNPRYADEAIKLFLTEVKKQGTRLNDYEVSLLGASNMVVHRYGECRAFESCSGCISVACRNRSAAYAIVKSFDLNIKNVELGGSEARVIKIFTESGQIVVKHIPVLINYKKGDSPNDKSAYRR